MTQKGNMYTWAKPWNPLAGECPHKCGYCSTKTLKRFPIVAEKYSGPLRLDQKEMEKDLGKGKTIFVCGQNDLFAAEVPTDVIRQVLEKCTKHPDNTYFFQTKNPDRMIPFLKFFPDKSIFCTTVESNRTHQSMLHCPPVSERIIAMRNIRNIGYRTEITIEPIMDFDIDEFIDLIRYAMPAKINIGADSKNHHLPEPSRDKLIIFIKALEAITVVEQKSNLKRLLK